MARARGSPTGGLGPTALGGVVVVEQYRVPPRFAAPPFAVACAIIASSR
jgi:hypothetical protein